MKLRLLLLLLLSFAVCYPVFAQTPQQSMMNTLHKKDSALYGRVRQNNVAKTTNTTISRLIARSYIGTGGESGSLHFGLQDSTIYSYSGDRGGDLTHTLNYDTSYNYDTTATTPDVSQTQTFDANNNILTTTVSFLNSTGTALVNDNNAVFIYDGNNNPVTQTLQQWDATTSSWVSYYRQLRTYDANHNFLTILVEGWDATNSVWDTSEMFSYTYTPANMMQSVLTQSWNGAWQPVGFDSSTYDNNNNQLTEVSQMWSTAAGSYVNSFQFIYTYDANNNQVTALEQLWYPGWVDFSLDNYSNFILQQPQVDSNLEYSGTTSSLVNNIKHIYTYNTYNQQTQEIQEQWNDTTQSWQQPYRFYNYYYETHTLGINPISNNGGIASIYPVPAQDVLHINLTWDAPQACNIAIYDALGRVCRQWQVPAATTYNGTVSVSNFAEGNYFINITGDKGKIVQKLVVAK